MTAHALSAHADSSLAALAFAEAVAEGNRINWGHMLDNTDDGDLLVGLTIVVVKLAQALAARSECSLDEVFEMHRALFLHYGNPQESSGR